MAVVAMTTLTVLVLCSNIWLYLSSSPGSVNGENSKVNETIQGNLTYLRSLSELTHTFTRLPQIAKPQEVKPSLKASLDEQVFGRLETNISVLPSTLKTKRGKSFGKNPLSNIQNDSTDGLIDPEEKYDITSWTQTTRTPTDSVVVQNSTKQMSRTSTNISLENLEPSLLRTVAESVANGHNASDDKVLLNSTDKFGDNFSSHSRYLHLAKSGSANQLTENSVEDTFDNHQNPETGISLKQKDLDFSKERLDLDDRVNSANNRTNGIRYPTDEEENQAKIGNNFSGRPVPETSQQYENETSVLGDTLDSFNRTTWSGEPLHGAAIANSSQDIPGTKNGTTAFADAGRSTMDMTTTARQQKQRTATDSSLTSPWVSWGACTVTCGTGTQERSRACGSFCREVESRECYLDSCHGIMSGAKFSYEETGSVHGNVHPYNSSEIPEQTFLNTEVDACSMWATCKDEYLQIYMSHLSELANCPCYYPFNLRLNSDVWDDEKRKYFQWVDVNSTEEKLAVYKPESAHCIRSVLFPGAKTLAAQFCCYDSNLRLVTRGRNAGTPNLISPQISWELHYKIDILPWVICKGDWTRYNQVLSPNNMLGCVDSPEFDQFLLEAQEARDH